MLTGNENTLPHPMPSSFISPCFTPPCSALVITWANFVILFPPLSVTCFPNSHTV